MIENLFYFINVIGYRKRVEIFYKELVLSDGLIRSWKFTFMVKWYIKTEQLSTNEITNK